VLLAGSEAGKVPSRRLSSSLCNFLSDFTSCFGSAACLSVGAELELFGHGAPRFAGLTLFVTGWFRAGERTQAVLVVLFFFGHWAACIKQQNFNSSALPRICSVARRSGGRSLPAPAWWWQPANRRGSAARGDGSAHVLSTAAFSWLDLRRRRRSPDGDARRSNVIALAGRVFAQDPSARTLVKIDLTTGADAELRRSRRPGSPTGKASAAPEDLEILPASPPNHTPLRK
jgi:hypothetical protein